MSTAPLRRGSSSRSRTSIPFPDWLPDHAAALTEPLACVCNALFDPPVVAPGDEVLVLGPGAIGLLAAQAVRAAGGRVTVVGTERDTARLRSPLSSAWKLVL